MEIEITDKRENPLLNRTEIKFKINHEAKPTPKRKEVREALAKMNNTQKERVVVDHFNSVFGKSESVGYAKVYKSKKDAMRIEGEALKRKHGLVEPKEAKKNAPEEKPAEEKK